MSRTSTSATRRAGAKRVTKGPGPRRGVSRGQRVVAIIVAVGLVGALGLAASQAFRRGSGATGPAFPAPTMVATSVSIVKPVRAGRVTLWPLPEKLVGPRDVLVGPDGSVWTTEQNRGRVDALNGDSLTRYATDTFPYVGAFSLAQGPGGWIWFTGYPGGSIARIQSSGSANGFAPFADGAATVGIAQGPDGSMWIADATRPVLERIGTNSAVSPYVVPPPAGGSQTEVKPRDIARGAHGTLWFTDPGTGAVGSISTASPPVIVEHPLRVGRHPRSIAVAPDGSVWVTLTEQQALAKIDPSTGTAQLVPLGSASGTLNDLLVAPDGTLWVSEDGPYLLHVRPDGSLIERIKLPDGIVYTDGLAQASDGTIWAAATDASALISVAPSS